MSVEKLRKHYAEPELFDKNSTQYKDLIKKRFFTVFEFACLMANLNPHRSLLPDEITIKRTKPFISLLREGYVNKNSTAFLCGIEAKNKPAEPFELNLFPIEAFIKFCSDRRITFPFEVKKAKELKTRTFNLIGTKFKTLIKGSPEWQEWRNKPSYTIEEIAYLILEIIPIEDGRFIEEYFYNQYIHPLVDEIKLKVGGLIDDLPPVDLGNLDDLDYCEPDIALYGMEGSRNKDGVATFPKEAYKRFCYNNNYKFPFPEESDTEELLGITLSLATENPAQSELKTLRDQVKELQQEKDRLQEERNQLRNEPVRSRDTSTECELSETMEIINGITVGHMKQLLDPNSQEYRPRLEALVRSLISAFGIKEESSKYKNTLEAEIKKNLEALEIGSYNGSEINYYVNVDKEALTRIAKKSKLSKGGRPNK